ncbi:hypothetical protein D3C78_811790 [compost metagenome]
MLVVDHNALQSIDFLDFVHEVGSQSLHALDRQNVVRRRVAVENVFALLDVVAFLKMEGLALRDQVFDRLDAVFRRLDHHATLVLVVAAEADRTINLGDDGVILRTTCFEQFGNTRQTTGDVLGLGAFQRRTCKHVTLGDLGTRLDRQDGIHGQMEAGFATTAKLRHSAGSVLDDDRGLQVRTARRRTPVNDLTLGDAGGFVGRFQNGETVDEVFEVNGTFHFRHHRTGVGVPLCKTLATLNLVAIIHEDLRTVSDTLRGTFRAALIKDRNGHVTAHGDENAFRVPQDVAVLDLDRAFIRRFEERLVDHVRRTAKVERTHGELRARFTDRLCGDDANGFAHVDRRTACKVTTVADAADADLHFAGQSGADADGLDARLFDGGHIGLIDKRAGLDDVLAGNRMIDIVQSRTA